MRQPDEEIRRLVTEWVAKAKLDFDMVVRLADEGAVLGMLSRSMLSRRRRST